jgi:hypothetical protein
MASPFLNGSTNPKCQIIDQNMSNDLYLRRRAAGRAKQVDRVTVRDQTKEDPEPTLPDPLFLCPNRCSASPFATRVFGASICLPAAEYNRNQAED